MPKTLAVNCCVCPAVRFTVFGLTETITIGEGVRVTVAVSNLLESAALVALTVADCTLGIDPGAVYSPVALIVPAPEITVHVTAVFGVPVTLTPNCCV